MLRDFAPVVQISTSPAVLVVNKDFPVRSVRDLIELARGKPGTISYGSAGIGSFAFLAAGCSGRSPASISPIFLIAAPGRR